MMHSQFLLTISLFMAVVWISIRAISEDQRQFVSEMYEEFPKISKYQKVPKYQNVAFSHPLYHFLCCFNYSDTVFITKYILGKEGESNGSLF